MDLLLELSQSYQINTQKPFFPVNTMRLFYLGLTQTISQDESKVVLTNSVVPQISSLTDQLESSTSGDRTSLTQLSELEETVASEWLKPALRAIVASLPEIQQHSAKLFKQLMDQSSVKAEIIDGFLLVRSLDSSIYAATVAAIIDSPQELASDLVVQLTETVRATLQLNDLVDAIVHAEEDVKSGFAPIIQLLQKLEMPAETSPRDYLSSLLTSRQETAVQAAPPKAAQFVTEFTSRLISAATGGDIQATDPSAPDTAEALEPTLQPETAQSV